MSVKVRAGAVDRLFTAPSGTAGQWVYGRGLRVESRAKQLCPVDTGRLRGSITTTRPVRRGKNLVVYVGTNVKYARYVEEGTKAHVVRPVRRKALRFTIGRRVVFSKYARIRARKGVHI